MVKQRVELCKGRPGVLKAELGFAFQDNHNATSSAATRVMRSVSEQALFQIYDFFLMVENKRKKLSVD